MRNVVLVFSLLFIFAPDVSGQASRPFDIYVGGVISPASSPSWFKDFWKDGSHFTGGIGYRALPKIQIVLKVQYHNFPYDYDRLDASGVIGSSQNLYLGGIDGRLSTNLPGTRIRPFMFAGLGVAKLTTSGHSDGWRRFTTPLEETRMYTNVGGGIEFKIVPILTFFVQAGFVSISTTRGDFSFIPITAGLRL
jgi:hypothetical protein